MLKGLEIEMDKERREITVVSKSGSNQDFIVDVFDEHVDILGYFSKDTVDMEIPDVIDGKVVLNIGQECFFNHDEIKTVSFPRGLKSIGDGAFRDCTGLRKIVLPAGLKSLRHGTFSFCYLADDVEIVFKEGLEKIESHIFYDGVGSAFSVELPRSVKEIAVGAFPPNVRISTELPYERGWQMDWPYGEIVRKGSVEGRVDDYDKICKDCMILDVDFNGDHEKAFYPIDFWDEIFLFDDQKNTDITNRLHQEPGYEKKARAVYNGWKRGLY